MIATLLIAAIYVSWVVVIVDDHGMAKSLRLFLLIGLPIIGGLAAVATK